MTIDSPVVSLLACGRRAASLIIRIAAVYTVLQLAGVAQAQTTTGPSKFYHCGREVSLSTSIIAADGNSVATLYRFEFSTNADFNPVLLAVDVARGKTPAFVEFPQFRYATTYYVRVSVKYNDNLSDPWTPPGPACSFTTINIRYYYCGREVSLSTSIVAADGNTVAALYRFEFSTSADFNPVLLAVDVTARGRNPAFVEFPQFRYATTYYVRVSVKYNDNPADPWTPPGPACSFTTINISYYHCGREVSLSTSIVAADGNTVAALYRFEFSTSADFNPILLAVDVTARGRNPAFVEFPQFRYATTYYVRVRVKYNDSPLDPWTPPGPACSFTIIACPTPLQLLAKSTNSVCGVNGSVRVAVSGGTPPYAYAWSPGGGTLPAIDGLPSGVYVVKVEDTRGCTGNAQVAVGGSAIPLSLCIKTSDATCANNDGSATIMVEGGMPPYSYNWSTTPPQQTPALAALSEGAYTITVADASGCIRKITVVIGRGACAQ